MEYNKPKPWNGKDLQGDYQVTAKIDGVRALVKDGNAVSRAGKPLYGLSSFPDGDYEIFDKDWATSVSLVRTRTAHDVALTYGYSLDPLDPRLDLGSVRDPTAAYIKQALKQAQTTGYEGLVLRSLDGSNTWIKVKSSDTYDVQITFIKPGLGKHSGKMGALGTSMGQVGTGFTDAERSQEWILGTVIEVECMGLTPDGKFRHPRFKRIRWDKDAK